MFGMTTCGKIRKLCGLLVFYFVSYLVSYSMHIFKRISLKTAKLDSVVVTDLNRFLQTAKKNAPLCMIRLGLANCT